MDQQMQDLSLSLLVCKSCLSCWDHAALCEPMSTQERSSLRSAPGKSCSGSSATKYLEASFNNRHSPTLENQKLLEPRSVSPKVCPQIILGEHSGSRKKKKKRVLNLESKFLSLNQGPGLETDCSTVSKLLSSQLERPPWSPSPTPGTLSRLVTRHSEDVTFLPVDWGI